MSLADSRSPLRLSLLPACLGLGLLGLCLLGSAACGPGPTGAFFDLAFERDGLGADVATVASAVVLDADKAPAWLGAERAGVSATATPSLQAPLNVCRVETGVGEDVTTLHLLDPGAATLKGPAGEQPLGATPPAFGDGTAYTARFDAGEIPYQPGGAFSLQTAGNEAPPFTANYTAPAEFQVERLGFVTPGPGTAAIPTGADLEIVWSPKSDDDMYLILVAGNARLTCRVRDSGSGTIKAKILEKLPVGPATLFVERSKQVDMGLQAGAAGKIPGTGRIALQYKFPIELQ